MLDINQFAHRRHQTEANISSRSYVKLDSRELLFLLKEKVATELKNETSHIKQLLLTHDFSALELLLDSILNVHQQKLQIFSLQDEILDIMQSLSALAFEQDNEVRLKILELPAVISADKDKIRSLIFSILRIALRSCNRAIIHFLVKPEVVSPGMLNVYFTAVFEQGKLTQKNLNRLFDSSRKSKMWNLQKFRQITKLQTWYTYDWPMNKMSKWSSWKIKDIDAQKLSKHQNKNPNFNWDKRQMEFQDQKKVNKCKSITQIIQEEDSLEQLSIGSQDGRHNTTQKYDKNANPGTVFKGDKVVHFTQRFDKSFLETTMSNTIPSLPNSPYNYSVTESEEEWGSFVNSNSKELLTVQKPHLRSGSGNLYHSKEYTLMYIQQELMRQQQEAALQKINNGKFQRTKDKNARTQLEQPQI